MRCKKNNNKDSRKNTWIYVVLVLIFLFVLFSRLYFAFQTNEFSADSAYSQIRQVENILKTGLVVFTDPLSYSGSQNVFSPLFHYILAAFGLVFPLFYVFKIVPNIFASLLVVIIYLLVFELVGDKKTALVSAFVAGFIPVYFNATFNSISTYSLVVPLVFLQFYLFLKLAHGKNKKSLYTYLVALIILSFTHPISILFVISLIIYLIMLSAEELKANRAEFELVLFSSFFVLWSQLIIYKKIIVFHGASVLWQNIPKRLLSDYFTQITILEGIYQIGLVLFICGVYMIYRYLFGTKQKDSALLLSAIIASSIILWFKLLPIEIGLIFLGVLLVLYFAKFVESYKHYFKKTQVEQYSQIVTLIFIIAFIFTSVVPSFDYANKTLDRGISGDDLEVFNWAKNNLNSSKVMLASPEEGYLISGIAKLKNVMDTNFLLKIKINQRYSDIETIYTTPYEIEALHLIEKYNVDYIIISQKTKDYYGVLDPPYLSDKNCFTPIYSSNSTIYEVKCGLDLDK